MQLPSLLVPSTARAQQPWPQHGQPRQRQAAHVVARVARLWPGQGPVTLATTCTAGFSQAAHVVPNVLGPWHRCPISWQAEQRLASRSQLWQKATHLWPGWQGNGQGCEALATPTKLWQGLLGPGQAGQAVIRLASKPSHNMTSLARAQQAFTQLGEPGAWQHTHTACPQPCQPDPS